MSATSNETRGVRLFGGGVRRRPIGDTVLFGATGAAALLIVGMLALILIDALRYGAVTLSWKFLTLPPSGGMTAGGVGPAVFGTAALTIVMTVAVVPVGVLTAIWLSEYAAPGSRLARGVRLAVANLAGVPSIVFGLFGLGFFVQAIGGSIDRLAYGGKVTYGQPALVWSALTLALLTLPVVIVATEEALRAVPRSLREASLALGASRLQTTFHVVVPQALGGILTGAILAVSRGAGEVAPILFTGAAYYLPELPTHLNDQFMHLGYHVYVLATQSPDVDRTKPLLYGSVLVLLGLTFALNAVAVVLRSRMRRRMGGGR
ncbi:MAG: phosphate ABC transporter permease PstA [Polyangiales bacterium]